MSEGELCCPDLQFICKRVRQKLDNYVSYQFTREQNDILKTFFDLDRRVLLFRQTQDATLFEFFHTAIL